MEAWTQQKRGDDVFEEGGWDPNAHYEPIKY